MDVLEQFTGIALVCIGLAIIWLPLAIIVGGIMLTLHGILREMQRAHQVVITEETEVDDGSVSIST